MTIQSPVRLISVVENGALALITEAETLELLLTDRPEEAVFFTTVLPFVSQGGDGEEGDEEESPSEPEDVSAAAEADEL